MVVKSKIIVVNKTTFLNYKYELKIIDFFFQIWLTGTYRHRLRTFLFSFQKIYFYEFTEFEKNHFNTQNLFKNYF